MYAIWLSVILLKCLNSVSVSVDTLWGWDTLFADIADILPISCFSDSDTLETLDTLLVGKKTYDKVSPVRGL